MKILFLALDIILERKAGDSIHVRELATSFAKLGNEVILVTASSPQQNTISDSKIENLNFYFRDKHDNLSTLSFCGNIIKKHGPDVIYERRYSGKIGATLSKIHKIPLIMEINGLAEEEARILGTEVKRFFLTRRFKKFMRKRFFARATTIVAVSEGIKKGLSKLYKIPSKKIIVVPNGANTELFSPMAEEDCKKELNLENDQIYFCFVGNLVSWQGIDYLLKAAPLVFKDVTNAKLLIVGDGPIRGELARIAKELKIEEGVIFTGSVPYETVPKYINASKIGVSIKPPLVPGSPLKVKEYLSCKKPVIATKESEYDFHIIKNANAGILVDPTNPEEVAKAIIKLLTDTDLNLSMGKNGRRLVLDKYSWLHVAKKIEKLCKNAVIGKAT